MVTEEQSIPRETSESLYGRSVLFRQFNDIDFYVEDEEQENLYFEILRKLFTDIRIENVYPLRGKDNVIAHAIDQQAKSRISVFIVDKDFDDLLGRCQNVPGLFYLKRFCIENYLLETEAFTKYTISELPRIKAEDIGERFIFNDNLETTICELTKLFSVYFIVQKHLPAYIKSTGLLVGTFCSKDDHGSLDAGLIERYVNSVVAELKRHKPDLKLSDLIKSCAGLFCKSDAAAAHISGEYIIYLMAARSNRCFGLTSQISIDSLRYRLAQYCKLDSLAWLKSDVEVYIAKRKMT